VWCSHELDLNHHLSVRGEFDRIAYEVDQDLTQAPWIALQGVRNVWLHTIGQFQPFIVRPQRQSLSVMPRLSRRLKAIVSIVSLPASILEKSRISLRRLRSDSAEVLTVDR